MRSLLRYLLVFVVAFSSATTASAKGGFETTQKVMKRAIREKFFESGVLRVGLRGERLYESAFGHATKRSRFDLASLTKALATTTTLMRLQAQGRVSTSSKLETIVPSTTKQPVGKARIDQLLSHSSGLAARNRLRDQAQGLTPREAHLALPYLAARYPRAYMPGSETVYSDLNFLLAGRVAEASGGARLDALAIELVFAPLKLRHTGFIAHDGPAPPIETIVPTEKPDGHMRLRGVVHDEKARAMGGVAGHAGLFSTAKDVDTILRSVADAYHGRSSIFSTKVARHFIDSEPVLGSGRRLGWDTAGKKSTGSLFAGREAIGHTGFTGTSAWIDLDRELSVVLLTNRVYYGREPKKITKYRALIHDAIAKDLAAATAP